MEVYRISSAKYANKLQASGVANRWNKEGEYVIYAAESRSLATLEMVAHRNAIMSGQKFKLMTISIPANSKYYNHYQKKGLPKGWNSPKNKQQLQNFGSDWYKANDSICLLVPSVIIPQEFNIVINTKHPHFNKIKLVKVEDYNWDERLL